MVVFVGKKQNNGGVLLFARQAVVGDLSVKEPNTVVCLSFPRQAVAGDLVC